MKLLCFLMFLIPSVSLAGDDNQWHWRYGTSAWKGWFETKGMGKVTIESNKISASLFDHKDTTFQRIKFEGSINKNKAEVTVTVLNTDIGKFKMSGKLSSREFNGQIIQALIFTSDWRYLALTRRITSKTPNKSLNQIGAKNAPPG